jgi:small subunit ribosomal protein S4
MWFLGWGLDLLALKQDNLLVMQGVLLNGKRNNIPSAKVRPNDTISLADKAKNQLRVKSAFELAEQIGIPDWVSVDSKKMEGVYKRVPDRGDLPPDINESLIVELYSR